MRVRECREEKNSQKNIRRSDCLYEQSHGETREGKTGGKTGRGRKKRQDIHASHVVTGERKEGNGEGERGLHTAVTLDCIPFHNRIESYGSSLLLVSHTRTVLSPTASATRMGSRGEMSIAYTNPPSPGMRHVLL
jgi:hypothetical protein